jgi:hypothetical protein
MSSVLLATQALALECIPEKFVVDFAKHIGVSREWWRSQQSKAFYQRLKTEILGQNPLRNGVIQAQMLETPEVCLALLGPLCHRVAKNHRAVVQTYQQVSAIAQSGMRGMSELPETRQQLNQLQQQLVLKVEKLEAQWQDTSLFHLGSKHCEHVFARWQAGHYRTFSPAGRCYAALQELHWGAFGDVLRCGTPQQAAHLREQARALVINHLAQDVNASAGTRHYYYEWLKFPAASGVMESKEALAWLGDDCDNERQPVSFSASQTHLGVSLGMPRLCSAMRLGSAMVDEVFSHNGGA